VPTEVQFEDDKSHHSEGKAVNERFGKRRVFAH